MISIYKSNNGKLELMNQPVLGSWINVVDPTPLEIDQLTAMGLPMDYVTYPLDLDELARTERENGERLIVLRIPCYTGESSDIPYQTMPLGIILTSELIVTVSKVRTEIIEDFLNGRIREVATGKVNRFVLRILLRTAEKFLSYLHQINHKVEEIEDKLQRSTKNKELMELLKYQKSLTLFMTALKSNLVMMERLHRSQIFHKYPEDEDLLEDVLTENQQAIQMTDIAANILSAMMDAFASIISNNLNDVMKILASITIVVSLPTIIFSFYGMNVDLPFDTHSLAFMIILLMSIALVGVAGWFFVRRDWL
ncbi:MAG TPA: magnesium transporter CorA family protein [Anaerolineales bacterium]|nr:magnesium transporter CorA family protein [Anaerolineales bacterium]